MESRARTQLIDALVSGIAPLQIHLSDADLTLYVETLQLGCVERCRRVHVIFLVALDLRKEINLRIEVKRRSGRSRSNEQPGFQPHHALVTQFRAQVDDLRE